MKLETLDLFRTRPALEVYRFGFENARAHHFGVRDAETGTLGCGGSLDALEAQRKALYEWIERRVFRASSSPTSSGWAAHSSPEAAERAAGHELVERDALLVSWLLRISPKNLGPKPFPAFGKEFPLLQFGAGPGFVVCGVLLGNERGRMLISATAASPEEAAAKLLVDSERALGALANGVPESLEEHHKEFCALPPEELEWLFENGAGIEYPQVDIRCHVAHAPLWDGTHAYVAEATSDSLQPLYFGAGSLRLIHRKRLRTLRARRQRLNRARHPVL